MLLCLKARDFEEEPLFLVTICWWVPSALWGWSLALGPWLVINAGLWSLLPLPAYWRGGVIGSTLAFLILVIMVPTFSTGLYAITFSAEWAFWIGTFWFLARAYSSGRSGPKQDMRTLG